MNQQFRTASCVLVAAIAVSGLAGCSGDSSLHAPDEPGSDATASEYYALDGRHEGVAPQVTTPPNLPKPTVPELDARIRIALDPSVDSTTKASWLESARQDPELAARLVEASTEKGVTVGITGIGEPTNGTLRANAAIVIDGLPIEGATVEFVAEGDQWKIGHRFACDIIHRAQLDSAACQNA